MRKATFYHNGSEATSSIARQLRERGLEVREIISNTRKPVLSTETDFAVGLRTICDSYSVHPND